MKNDKGLNNHFFILLFFTLSKMNNQKLFVLNVLTNNDTIFKCTNSFYGFTLPVLYLIKLDDSEKIDYIDNNNHEKSFLGS